MQFLDGRLRGQTGRYQFAAAGKSQHQMRLDESQGQVQVCPDKALVYEYRSARFSRTEAAMLGCVAGVMIENLEIGGDVFAQDVPNFSRCRRTVEARSDQNA